MAIRSIAGYWRLDDYKNALRSARARERPKPGRSMGTVVRDPGTGNGTGPARGWQWPRGLASGPAGSSG